MKQIRVYDIKWFYNYEDHMDDQSKEEYDATFNAEPTEMIIDTTDWDEKHLQEDWIEDSISDYISDESGYYHEGYSYEWVKEEDNELTKLVDWAWSTKQLLEGILEDLNDGTLLREYNQDDLEFNIQSKLNSINGQIKVFK